MRKTLLTRLVFGMMLLAAMSSCQEDVDLNQIDLSADVDLGIALPVVSMSASIGDFIGNGQVENFFVGTADDGYVIYFCDTFSTERYFHPLDLSQYLSKMQKEAKVYSQLQAKGFLNNHQVTGNSNVQVRLDFPIVVKLQGVNNDLSNERLDSVRVATANFTSMVGKHNLPLDWNWIDSITLDLGPQVRRDKGNSLVIYRQGDGYGYDKEIPITVDDFTVNLMRNQHPATPEQYAGNVVDTCAFEIHFYFKVPTSAGTLTVNEDAAFQYELGVRFIDYVAIWGMFKPSGDMKAEQLVNISSEWAGWKLFKNATVPFSDPVVNADITTHIAGALVLQGDYLFIQSDKTKEKIYALFNGYPTMTKYFTKSEYLPLTSPIGDSVKLRVRFDKDPARGQIDRLFTARPDNLGYKFSVDFNRQETPQIRITPNTGIRVDAEAILPMKFNQGLNISYSDTIRDIDVSQFQLDSLQSEVEMIDSIKTSDLKLVIKAENTIPVQIKAVLRCLDENGRVIMDPINAGNPLQLTEQDTLRFLPPTYINHAGDWAFSKPGETTIVVSLNKQRLELLPTVKAMYIEASLDDKPLDSVYQGGNFHVKLTRDQKLKLRLGISAKAGVVLNLNPKQ